MRAARDSGRDEPATSSAVLHGTHKGLDAERGEWRQDDMGKEEEPPQHPQRCGGPDGSMLAISANPGPASAKVSSVHQKNQGTPTRRDRRAEHDERGLEPGERGAERHEALEPRSRLGSGSDEVKGAVVAAKKMRQECGRRRHRAPIQIGIVRGGPGDVRVRQDADDNDRRDGELRSGPGEDGGRPMPPQHDGRGRNQEHDRQVIRDAERAAECREESHQRDRAGAASHRTRK